MTSTSETTLAWLIWCWNEGYTNPEDRALMSNWLEDDPATLHPDDVATRSALLGMAKEIMEALGADIEPDFEEVGS